MTELPTKPSLTLNADQIIDLGFHRGGREHECSSPNIGYPFGTMSVVFRKQGESDFQPFDDSRIVYYRSNTTTDACTTSYSLKFGLNFTDADTDGEVKCAVTQDVTLESDVQSLELIPRK